MILVPCSKPTGDRKLKLMGGKYATQKLRTTGQKKAREMTLQKQSQENKRKRNLLKDAPRAQKKQKIDIKEVKELEDLIYPEDGDSILSVDQDMLVKLLSTIAEIEKRMEVRPCITNKPIGKIIYLSANGTGEIQGYVKFGGWIPLHRRNWATYRPLHRMEGGLYYKGKTKQGKIRKNFGYYMNEPRTFPMPIPYKCNLGARNWKYYHPM